MNSLLITKSDQYPVDVAVVLVLLSDPLSPITVHVVAIPFTGGRTTDVAPAVVVVAVALVSEPLAEIVGHVVDIPLKEGGGVDVSPDVFTFGGVGNAVVVVDYYSHHLSC